MNVSQHGICFLEREICPFATVMSHDDVNAEYVNFISTSLNTMRIVKMKDDDDLG